MLAAIAEADGDTAETLARQHVMQAANFIIARLRTQRRPGAAEGSAVAAAPA